MLEAAVTCLMNQIGQHLIWLANNNVIADLPEYYAIYNSQFYLYPFPRNHGALYVDYWKFLARPVTASWSGDSTSDLLTEHGGMAIVYRTVAQLCLINKDFDKYNQYMNLYANELASLMVLNESHTAIFDTGRYADYW